MKIKLLPVVTIVAIILLMPSCKRVFVCGCSAYQTTPDSIGIYIDTFSDRFKAYKPEAEDYCKEEFTDSLNRQFGVNNTQCFVN